MYTRARTLHEEEPLLLIPPSAEGRQSRMALAEGDDGRELLDSFFSMNDIEALFLDDAHRAEAADPPPPPEFLHEVCEELRREGRGAFAALLEVNRVELAPVI